MSEPSVNEAQSGCFVASALLDPVPAQNCEPSRMIEDFPGAPRATGGMVTILSALVSLLSFRVRNRASPELELVALRHQVTA
jgi:hypothetical protein